MRYIKILTLALAALCVMAIAATAAQAELEFLMLPGGATFSFHSAGVTELETLSGKVVSCLGVSGKGETLTPDSRLGPVEFKFTDCSTLGGSIKCTGLSDTVTGNITFSGEYHLRHLLPQSEGVSLMILPGHVHFSCSIALILVLGSVCSDDLLTKEKGENVVDKLLEKIFVNFLINGFTGDPVVTEVDTDNSLGMEKCVLLTKEGSGAYESSAQHGSGFVESCVTGGKVCTLLVDLLGTY